MMLISTAYAQDAAGLLGGLGGIGQFLPLVLIFGVFYFLLIRPQQQKQKELRNMVAALKRGDRVVTGGGIVGIVQKTREGSSELEVEIAPNVRVMVLRETITSVLQPPIANDSKPAKDS
jgi:preprotein translocase subunit YajC